MGYEEIVEKVEAYSNRVREHCRPEMIVLYGSYAHGTADEHSDIDIAVICNTMSGDFMEDSAVLFRLRRDIDLRIEPVLIQTDDKDTGFYNDILKNGKIIYSQTA